MHSSHKGNFNVTIITEYILNNYYQLHMHHGI